ncbi:MAG: hypothetical protein ACPGWR_25515 [Ardenticatenaceae bacterium]
MTRFTQFMLVLLALIVVIVSLPVREVLACSPLPGYPNYTPADRTMAAEVVLEGRVVEVTKTEGFEQVATVEVSRYFKKSDFITEEPTVVTIDHLGSDAMCLAWVNVDDHLIFYTKGDPTNELRAHYLEPHDAVARPTREVINEIMHALLTEHDVYFPFLSK